MNSFTHWTDLKVQIPAEKAEEATAIAQMVVPYGLYLEDYSDLVEVAPQIAHIDLIDKDAEHEARREEEPHDETL